ncbi:MAG: SprT family zinc-dependent metalloprotease [Lachnospiraceae bacterium]|nr:SprT family zinc-dependent metalloprotease [Lachnospiraceae bacterium]
MSKKTIQYCGIPIEYTLTRKSVKNTNVRINEKGEIRVSARNGLPIEEINDFIESKAEWIIRTLAAVERYNMTKPDSEIYEGKKCYYLGEACVVEIKQSDMDFIEKNENIIKISSRQPNQRDIIKVQYLSWLKKEAAPVFNNSVMRMHSLAAKENIPIPAISIRNMKTRWGSCNPRSEKVTLNLQLMKADLECIDHVVLHELMHFKYSNHGKDFYALIHKYMPDWKEHRKRLNEKFKDGI